MTKRKTKKVGDVVTRIIKGKRLKFTIILGLDGKELLMPHRPDIFFKDSGWKGWDDFLGLNEENKN